MTSAVHHETLMGLAGYYDQGLHMAIEELQEGTHKVALRYALLESATGRHAHVKGRHYQVAASRSAVESIVLTVIRDGGDSALLPIIRGLLKETRE